MGIVDKLRTMVVTPEEPRGAYQCRSCRSRFEGRYHVCPDCGGYRVERVEWHHQ